MDGDYDNLNPLPTASNHWNFMLKELFVFSRFRLIGTHRDENTLAQLNGCLNYPKLAYIYVDWYWSLKFALNKRLPQTTGGSINWNPL